VLVSLRPRNSSPGESKEGKKVLTRRPLLEQVYCSEVFAPVQPTFHLPAILDNLIPLVRACNSLDGAAVAPIAAMRTRRLVNCILMGLIFR